MQKLNLWIRGAAHPSGEWEWGDLRDLQGAGYKEQRGEKGSGGELKPSPRLAFTLCPLTCVREQSYP